MKITAIIKNINQAFEIKDLVQTFIVPLKDYSINYVDTFSLDDVKVLLMVLFFMILQLLK